jgi:hypothetical protein
VDHVPHRLGDLPDGVVAPGADVDQVRGSSCAISSRQADARSSTWSSSRRGVPVPQTVTVDAPASLASWKRRISIGTTWPPTSSKLSFGPYRFVGMAATKSSPYCERYDWHSLMPAILAIA